MAWIRQDDSAPERLTYTVEEAAVATGLGRTTLFEFMKSGQLASIKVGRRRLIRPEALRDLLETLARASKRED